MKQREYSFPSSTNLGDIHADMWLPEGEIKAIVQISHGMAEYGLRYKDFAEYLCGNSVAVVVADHMGHGKSFDGKEENYGYFGSENGHAHLADDQAKLTDIVKNDYPGVPYILFGHSMGSFLARTLIIRYPEAYNAAVISGTGNQGAALVNGGLFMGNLITGLMGAHHYSKLLNNLAFGSYNKIYENPKTDYDWLSRDEANVQKYIDDPLCGFIPSCSLFRDMMTGVKFITNKKNLTKMNKNMPVYFMSGSMDPVGECGKGVEKAYNNFIEAGMNDVSIKLYPEGRHEMLNEINKKEVYSDVLAWLNSKI